MMADEKTILLVEDDESLAEILVMALESKGYAVKTACDGQKGFEMLSEAPPQLAILDVMMPKMDGFQLCRMIKFDDNFKHIPVIMLTARAQDEDKASGKEVGADLFLTKPCDIKEFLGHVQKLLPAP
jgi:DNA-binding response OmpR family regulator